MLSRKLAGWVVWGPMDAICRRCASNEAEARAGYPSWVTLVPLYGDEADTTICSRCDRPLRTGDGEDTEPA